MPWWRNGRRGRLKICCQQWREGSSPSRGTHKIITYSNMYVMIFSICVTETVSLARPANIPLLSAMPTPNEAKNSFGESQRDFQRRIYSAVLATFCEEYRADGGWHYNHSRLNRSMPNRRRRYFRFIAIYFLCVPRPRPCGGGQNRSCNCLLPGRVSACG